MEWVGKLVPKEAPEGLLTWETVRDELDVHGLVYEAVWITDNSLTAMLDDRASGRKIKAVRVRCSYCGREELLDWCPTEKYHGNYGFIHPDNYERCGSGEETLCPFCGVPVQVKKAAEIGCGCYETDATYCMSADVVGKHRLLALTCWKVVRVVYRDGKEELRAKACEAYVFGMGRECAKLVRWVKAYSGNVGYFRAFKLDWSQPKQWQETWGDVTGGIYGLTPELVASSCLPNCKLDVYMESFSAEKHKYPVAYLRLYQYHPNVENLLVSGLPMVLDDLLNECMTQTKWEKNVRGLPPIDDIDWQEARPAQMIGLTKEELRIGREQCWGALFWRLFTRAKDSGELLTGEDIRNAFYLGDEDVLGLIGQGPVGKSLRYMLKQIERADQDPETDVYVDVGDYISVQMLLDYWQMCRTCERDLDDPHVRWPKDLNEAHDIVMREAAQRRKKGLAGRFRQRRKHLARYIFEADGLLIVPAGSQKELDKEAKVLDHCVWTYGEGHANGDYAIFFIRRSVEPNVPYYTLQLDEKKLVVKQNRGHHNCSKTAAVQAFEDLWIAWLRAGAKRDKDGNPVIPQKKQKKTVA